MSRTLRVFAVTFLAAVALLGILASSALATLEDPPTPTLGKTLTNPSWGADAWWRQGWGNSLYPEFELNPPGVWEELTDGYLLGTLYTVDRDPSTSINTALPNNYYRDAFPVADGRPRGTNLDNTIDLLGVFLNPPTGSWPATATTLEGQWFLHYRFFSNFRYQTNQWDIPFGIDLTPPTAVDGLQVSSGLTAAPYDPNVWVPTKRGYVKWTPGVYDSLSGVGYYQVLIDDSPILPEKDASPIQGRAYSSNLLPLPDSITVESLPPGRHKLSVQAVDRATNPGPSSSVYYQSDPDTPTISWTAPTGSALVPSAHIISVNASDLAGDPTVVITLGASTLATLTAPPYTVTPDLSALATGTYTLSATVTDHLNRTVTLSKQVTWSPGGIAGSTADPSVTVTGTPGTSADSADVSTGGSTGWTNNLAPVAELLPPAPATDIFYSIVQTRTPLDPVNLQQYYHDVTQGGATLLRTVDLKDSIDLGGPWAPGPVGSVAPYEGTWYFQWVWYNKDTQGVSPSTYSLQFNVDRTPPAMVTGFAANPAAGTWVGSKRVHLTWNSQQYDALSGNFAYRIYMDDDPITSVNATSVMSGSATLEDVPAGAHKVSIAAVDKAGNVGPKSDLTIQSDTETPTISWILPTDTALNPRNRTISVIATDDAGDPTVVFKLDNGTSYAGTVTAPPYEVTPDLSALTAGAHTLTATVTDHFGRTVTLTKSVTWSSYDGSLDTTGVAGTSPASGPGVWTNSLFPTVSLNLSGGLYYNVVQTPSTVDPSSPNSWYHSIDGVGPLFNHVVNLKDSIDTGGPWAPGPAGSVAPYEGTWYFQWKWHSAAGDSQNTYRLPFNVDLTAPSAVADFVSDPPAGTWTSQQRVKLTWTDQEYDVLSRTSYYQLYLDGTAIEKVYRGEAVPNQLTYEDVPSGAHVFGIAAVDNAGNIGTMSTLTINSDTTAPSLSWLSPTSSTLTPTSHTIAVSATTAGGNPTVVFSINGSSVATLSAPPYAILPDFSSLTTNTPLLLSVTATGQNGRSTTITRSVTYEPGGTTPMTPTTDLDLTGDELGKTTTNPSFPFARGDIDSDRHGWGNSLNPQITLNYPSAAEGILYNVVTTTSSIDPSHPQNYYRASKPSGTHTDNTFDLQGIFDAPPAGGWRPGLFPGAKYPIEGVWYLQLLFYDRFGNVSSQTYRGGFGIDITPPSPVTGLGAAPSVGVTPTSSVTIPGSRVHLSWDASATYDTLSGVSYYKVLVDDAEVIPSDGIVWDVSGGIPNAATIENLTPGAHKISVVAVDRATNTSLPQSVYVYSDPDVPTVRITSPSGSAIGVRSTVSASVSDQGGVTSVVYRLDGTTLATVRSAPWSASVNLSAFSGDSPHTLTATVTDRYGRQATASKTVTIDKTPPSISGASASVNRRSVTVRARSSEQGTMRMSYVISTVSSRATVVTKTIASDGDSATFSFTVPRVSRTSSAYKRGLRITCYLTAVDKAGNSSSQVSRTVLVKFYKVVRKAGNRIQIINY